MLAHHHHNPDAETTLTFLREHLPARNYLLQVVGACEVMYAGRAVSTAEAGEYLTLVKPDGCLMVHGVRGVKPCNWQSSTDEIYAGLDDGCVVLTGERYKPHEIVRVRILECFALHAFALGEDGGFVLQGSEADMQRVLRSQPELLEPGLRIVDEELPTSVGAIDLYGRDIEGTPVVVELKRSKATHEAVHQLERYVREVAEVHPAGTRVRGILAAPDITLPALKSLERRGLEFKQITALPELEAEQVQPGLF